MDRKVKKIHSVAIVKTAGERSLKMHSLEIVILIKDFGRWDFNQEN